MIINTGSDRLVIVPMKDPASAKTRLKPALDNLQRQSFARLLFKHTLEILARIQTSNREGMFDVGVITGSEKIAAIAHCYTSIVITEMPAYSLNAAANQAAQWALEHKYTSLCILPADLAVVDEEELSALLSNPLTDNRVVICPSTDQGTNALLMSPPDAIKFRYGPRSCHRHYQIAREKGLFPLMASYESLKFDVDTSDDLAQLLQIAPQLSNVFASE